ncbi:MAG: glutamine--tRNA ligase, partial [Acutalibacteraceae bacterium]
LNPDSVKVMTGCKVTDDVVSAAVGDTFQFMRMGYFCIDKDSSVDNIVINRVTALKDSWKK